MTKAADKTKAAAKLKPQPRRKSKFKGRIVLVLILLSLGIGLGGGYVLWHTGDVWWHTGDVWEIEKVLVVRAIDGDTIELEDGRRVRYLGIDTPEAEEFYASEATERNKQLVEDKLVELQQGKRDKDEYGRLLRYVYIDGTFVNAELVAQGFAQAYVFDENERYSQVLVQLEQYAKMNHVGMWE
jgi:micrococcal nuclease